MVLWVHLHLQLPELLHQNVDNRVRCGRQSPRQRGDAVENIALGQSANCPGNIEITRTIPRDLANPDSFVQLPDLDG